MDQDSTERDSSAGDPPADDPIGLDSPDRLTWAPQAALVGIGWVMAAVAAVLTVAWDDRRGMVLLAIATAALVVLSLAGTVARPRLAVDREGVAVKGLAGTKRWPWAAVTLRLAVHRRFGREVNTVEIESADSFLVLGRIDLGEDPHDVVSSALALRP